MNAEISEQKRGRGRPRKYKTEIEQDIAFRKTLEKYYYGKRRDILIQKRKENSTFISKADLLAKLHSFDISENEKKEIAKLKKKELQKVVENLEKNLEEYREE